MSARRGTGYRPDPPGYRRTPVHRLLARAGGELPPFIDLGVYCPSVMDQGDTGACTGHATASAIFCALAAARTPLPWVPSPAGIYTLGRCIDRTDPSTPLRDEGAEPNQVFRGVSEWGVRPIQAPTPDGRYSDADPATINDEPELGDLEADAATILVGEYGITSTGAARIGDLRAALAMGKPVTVAIAGGSSAFQSYTGGVIGMLRAPLDHYVYLFGYEMQPDGSCVLRGRNSWSADWGEQGDFRLSENAVQELDDLVAVDVRVVPAKEAA